MTLAFDEVDGPSKTRIARETSCELTEFGLTGYGVGRASDHGVAQSFEKQRIIDTARDRVAELACQGRGLGSHPVCGVLVSQLVWERSEQFARLAEFRDFDEQRPIVVLASELHMVAWLIPGEAVGDGARSLDLVAVDRQEEVMDPEIHIDKIAFQDSVELTGAGGKGNDAVAVEVEA